MSKYIYELADWPQFHWDEKRVNLTLSEVRHRQGRLLGLMEGLGFKLRAEAFLQALTEEVLKTSEIEGEKFERTQVRSSIARRMGMDVAGLTVSERKVDGVVDMMVDATQGYSSRLTQDRLFGWHAALFPSGRNGTTKIRVGKWRDDSHGPMQVVSGPIGKQKVHFQAPKASRLRTEVGAFLKWFNGKQDIDLVLKSGLTHLWFVTLHPFDDGNGRISRALADMVLARAEQSPQRFYSMSAQINAERNAYYNILETTQKGSLDITLWLTWFLKCLGRAIQGAETILANVLVKSQFWQKHANIDLNPRQKKMVNHLLDGFDGKLTTTKWAKICKVSQDTASRDIVALIDASILTKGLEGGRNTSYRLLDFPDSNSS